MIIYYRFSNVSARKALRNSFGSLLVFSFLFCPPDRSQTGLIAIALTFSPGTPPVGTHTARKNTIPIAGAEGQQYFEMIFVSWTRVGVLRIKKVPPRAHVCSVNNVYKHILYIYIYKPGAR